jgi:hypothetical protein
MRPKRSLKQLLPSGTELAILGTMAFLCAGMVDQQLSVPQDLMLSLMALPLFVTAAVMGLRRSPQWADEPSQVTPTTPGVVDDVTPVE